MKPTMSTVLRGSSTLLRRWCRMRPASAIPLAEITTNGIRISFSSLLRDASRTYSSRSQPNGLESVMR